MAEGCGVFEDTERRHRVFEEQIEQMTLIEKEKKKKTESLDSSHGGLHLKPA